MLALDTRLFGYSQIDILAIPKIFFNGSFVSFFPEALTLALRTGI